MKFGARTPKPMPESTTSAAISKGYFKQVRYLLELGHRANARLEDGKTPLILCALVKDATWRAGLARSLLEKGGQVGLRDRNGLNALHYAAIYECEELVDIFLGAIDFDLNSVDRYGNTALFYAANTGNAAIVTSLLGAMSRYGLSVDRANRQGLTPLMQAWRTNHTKCASLLLECGASRELCDNAGKSAAEYEAECQDRLRRHEAQLEQRRAKSQIRFDDFRAWQRHQKQVRATPCPQFGTGGGAAAWRAEQLERRQNAMVAREEAAEIAEASPFNLNNDPVLVFKAAPADVFGGMGQRGKMSGRPKTAHPGVRCGAFSEHVGSGWKRSMTNLYHHLEFQCSSSFYPSAKTADDLSADSRTMNGISVKVGNSPVVSDTASEVTDRGSRVSRRTAPIKGQKSKPSSAQPRNRKTSTSTRLQSMDSVMEDESAVSADNGSMRSLRVRNKPPAGSAGGQSRPVSRAAFSQISSDLNSP